MDFILTYELNDSLYINMTNRCTNNCTFCVRNNNTGVKEDLDLWLEREPTVEEIVQSIKDRDLKQYKEITFCGYGEPMMRTFDILEISREIRKITDLPIRINTNGHANLIYGKDITPFLEGLIDSVSISLNAKTAKEYVDICLPNHGEDAFTGMIDFAVNCKKYVKKVVFTVVDVLSKDDIEVCRKIASDAGVDFKVRKMII